MSVPGVTLVFPAGKSKDLTTSDLALDGLEVRELRGELRGTGISAWAGRNIQGDKTTLDRTTDLVKRTNIAKIPASLEGLLCEPDEWLAGAVNALYRSKDKGETWKREDIAMRGELVVAVVRFGGRLWCAGALGALSWQGDDGVWYACERADARTHTKVTYGTMQPYPKVALTRLRIIDDHLYALGDGLWQIDASRPTHAPRVIASPSLLVDLAKTASGTLVAVGVDGAVHRREGSAEWSRVEVDAKQHHVGIVPMNDGLLLVATGAMFWSEDDGQTFVPIETGIDLGDLEDARYHVAISDGHGGALVAGWRGMLARVSHDGLGPWKGVKSAKPTKRAAAASVEKPRAKDPAIEARLVADVLASPNDDAPRLVYADWLTEHADPRGELIHLQCLLEHRRFGAQLRVQNRGLEVHPDHMKLEPREEALLKKHSKDWLAPVRPYFYQWSWKRGFLDYIATNGKFFAGAEEVLSRHPITHLEIGGLKKSEYAQLATVDLGTVRWLNLQEQRMTAKDVVVLLGPNLAKIESLFLWDNPLEDDGVIQLATKSHLHQLRELSLLNCRHTDDAVRAIAESPIFANLELLNISTNVGGITAAGLEALAGSKTLTKLQMVNHGLTSAADEESRAALARATLRARLTSGWNQRAWEPYTSPSRTSA